MNTDFVTVATFPDPATAYLANQHLEAAGIRGFIADENMDTIFGNAIGWVKLQVAREDAVRAAAVLEAKMPPDDTPPSEDIMTREEGIAAGAFGEESPDDEVEEQERRRGIQLDEKVTPEPDEVGLRSRLAERSFISSIAGLLFCPIQLYTCYLLLMVWLSDEPLTPRAKKRMWIAVLITVADLVILWLLYKRSEWLE